MERFAVLRAIAVLAVVSAVSTGCRAPLRGVGYGADSDPYLHERIIRRAEAGGDLVHRLVLIGDAGAPLPESDPTLELLGLWADAHPDRTTVLFLGDNVYPAGLRANDRAEGERILRQQLEATDVPKIFVPGNHDWGFSWNRRSIDGALLAQQEFLDAWKGSEARLEPREGCPGPVPVELVPARPGLEGGLTLLLLDLHWWLLPEEDRHVCEKIGSTTEFVERLRQELARRIDENVVVAAHHPIRSSGEHGGFTRGFWFDLGTAIFYRFYTVQDLVEPGYRQMIGVLSEVLAENTPLAMVAGHDHSLQIMDGGDEARLIVVSGSATKVSNVTSIDSTLFAHAKRGFIVFDFYETGPMDEGTLVVQVAEIGHGEEPVAVIGLELGREEEAPEAVPPARRQGSVLDPPQ